MRIEADCLVVQFLLPLFLPVLYLFLVWCFCNQGDFYPIFRIDLPYSRKIDILLGFFQQILKHNVNMGHYVFPLDVSWGINSVNRACFLLLRGYPNKLHILETANVVNCLAWFRNWTSWMVSMLSDNFIIFFALRLFFSFCAWDSSILSVKFFLLYFSEKYLS